MTHRFVLGAVLTLVGCGGFVPDEMPGQSSFLLGNVAVDPDTETTFAVDYDVIQTPDGLQSITVRSVVAARAGGGPAVVVRSLEGSDWLVGITFAPGRVVVSSRRLTAGDPELGTARYESTLSAYDADSLALLGEATVPGSFTFGGQSSSRRWALGSSYDGPDGTEETRYLVDVEGLVLRDVTAGLPAAPQFAHETDRIFGVVSAGDGDHLRAWGVDALVAGDFAQDEDGNWSGANLDLALDPGQADRAPVLSPNDDVAFFSSPAELLYLVSGVARPVDAELSSPVFTPDSSTIVGYRTDDPGPPAASLLVTIDVDSGDVTSTELPYSDTPNFFVTRSGHEVLVAPVSAEGRSLILFDLHDGTSSTAGGPGVRLGEFTSRVAAGEIWFLQDDALYCLDLAAGQTDYLPTDDFDPFALNILPARDELVMQADVGLVFYDPSARAVTRNVPLR